MAITLAKIATGTKILGGLSSIFGKKSNPFDDNLAASQGALTGRIKAATAAGLHPLTAVGGGGGGYAAAGSRDIGGGLDQVGRALEDHGKDKLDQKQSQLIDAQIAESRSRTILNQANSRRAIYGPMDNPTGATGGLETVTPGGMDPGSKGPRGERREPTPDMPARQEVSLGKYTAQGPNPEAFEVGVGELVAGALIYGPQWAKQALEEFRRRQAEKLERSKANRKPTGKRSTKTRGADRRAPWEH